MILEIPSLGRPFTLGMLYDCREEKLIPGITLWNREDMTKNICTVPKCNTSFEVLTSDTVFDKSSALNISGELKISVLGGKVNVEGSGAYITDTKESKVQARVTLKYERTTKFAHLSMDHLCTKNITYHEAFDKGIATHVVTGILYGAQAFFVFDQKVTNSKQVTEVQGMLKNIALKIVNLTGNLKKKDEETEKFRQFSCTFYGDFALEKNPVTHEEAVQVYESLPKLMGEDGENAVPLKVWLLPLKYLADKAAHLVREISDQLVFTAENIMENMSEVIMECNDMMKHPAAITFPTLYNKISQFKKLFEGFRLMFQKRMAKVLSSVRCGNKKESTLGDVLFGKEKSPFRDQNIQEFLGRSRLEMEVVCSLLKQLPGFRVASEQSELIKAILDPDFDITISFNFSSLTSEDLYLSHLKSWLQKETWDRQDVFKVGETKQWFENNGIKKQIRDLVTGFTALAREPKASENTQFLVTSVACNVAPGVTIQHYQNGDLVTTKCMPPAKPNVALITERTTNTMELMLQPEDYGREAIEGYKVEYKQADQQEWFKVTTRSNDKTTDVFGLKENSSYHFRYSAVCKTGLSEVSEVTKAYKTKKGG
ncbi:LOW QUALITY PROTEIN: stonustoxin subunit beta-like [Phyllobates terribilis]|uniref:LOW QUALITY PROTEIN: stonustoxin subunit beta-like n=1 Tax=Phyllobates terribilis TaxID=111132 RepID=UPI003CCB34D5